MPAAPKTTTKKTTTKKKTATKTTTTKKTATGKKPAKRAGGSRTYSPAASDQVRTELEEMKAGTLRSGRSGKKVTNPKQAIAIGLAEARRDGKKVPPNPKRSG